MGRELERFTKIMSLMLAVLMIAGLIQLQNVYADEESYQVYLNGAKTEYSGYYIKGNVYLPVTMIGSCFSNSGVSLNSAKNELNIDISKENILMADDTTTNFIKANAGVLSIPLKKINSKDYCFSMNVMEQFFKTSYQLSGNTIKLKSYSGSAEIARINADGAYAVPALNARKSEQLKLTKGERISISGQSDNYYKFEDIDGDTYYIMKSYVTKENIDLATLDFYAPKKTKFVQKANEKINLVWNYTNGTTSQAPSKYKGIDILSPTWFRLKVSDGGNLANVGDKGYTDLAHRNGYKVWACVTNNMSEKGSTKFTTEMFNTPSIQDKAIAQYILYSCIYDVDGINIDFEDVLDADANGLTNFTKQMRAYTERQGLNLSIDTLIPAAYTIEYDRDELAKYVDYVAIMTYDEYYSSSKTAGSTASLPWVEKAVKAALSEGVPANQLLMGIPLYTRDWVMDANGNKVSNTAYGMDSAQKILRDNNVTTSYLGEGGQNYAEFTDAKGLHKIWLEDETSITNRLNLVNSYNLAGSACWQYSQANEAIWSVFARELHK